MKFKPMTEQAEWEWVYERSFPIYCIDTQGIVAYDERGIQAVVVADSFTQSSCCVHFAIDNPMAIKHGLFHEVSRHLFNVCGRHSLIGLVPSNNDRAIALDLHIGFVEVGRVPDGQAEGVDTVILQLTRENAARWLEPLKEAA